MSYSMAYSTLRGIVISVLYSRFTMSHLPVLSCSTCQMIYNTCYIGPVLSDIPCYMALLYRIARVLYSQDMIWQIWVIHSSDPRFQMHLWPQAHSNSRRPGELISWSTLLNLLLVRLQTPPRLRLLLDLHVGLVVEVLIENISKWLCPQTSFLWHADASQ